MRLKDVFIKNLKEYRKKRGLSQLKLGMLCDTATSYIGQIEIGDKFPSFDMVEKLARALQIKPYLLFLEENSPDYALPPAQDSEKIEILSPAVKKELIRELSSAIERIVNRQ